MTRRFKYAKMYDEAFTGLKGVKKLLVSTEEKAYAEHSGFGSAKFLFESTEYTVPKSVEYDKVFCKNANALRSQTVCLFLHPTWEEVHIERCIDGFKKVLAAHIK